MPTLMYTRKTFDFELEDLHIYTQVESEIHPAHDQDNINYSVGVTYLDKDGEFLEAYSEFISNDGRFGHHDGLECAGGHLFSLTKYSNTLFLGEHELKTGLLKLSLEFNDLDTPQESATLIQTLPDGYVRQRTFTRE
jgi:hypothetical protein